jgi:uncharacterized membrane protein YoaK (UPF0700 family)
MTANVVLLGVQVAAGKLAQAQRHFIPIGAFIAGLVFARLLQPPSRCAVYRQSAPLRA